MIAFGVQVIVDFCIGGAYQTRTGHLLTASQTL